MSTQSAFTDLVLNFKTPLTRQILRFREEDPFDNNPLRLSSARCHLLTNPVHLNTESAISH